MKAEMLKGIWTRPLATLAGGPLGRDRAARSATSAPAGRSSLPATLPLTTVATAALAAATADLTLLAIIAGHALTAPGALRWAPVVAAVIASLTRGTLAAQAAGAAFGTRAALA